MGGIDGCILLLNELLVQYSMYFTQSKQTIIEMHLTLLGNIISTILHYQTYYRHWLKVTISLVAVMGIAWIGNILFFDINLIFVAYIMTIFIAGQGIIIFILFVPLSKQVCTFHSLNPLHYYNLSAWPLAYISPTICIV